MIDGDGLWHLITKPDILRGYKRAVITPNADEFSHLVKVILNKDMSPTVCPDHKLVGDLARALGNLAVIHKGAHDVISDGKSTEDCNAGGSPRRCGGQGDILAGSLATFLNWAYSSHSCDDPGPAVIASWGACRLSRACAAQAYNQEGRAGTALDIVNQIQAEFLRIYESETYI